MQISESIFARRIIIATSIIFLFGGMVALMLYAAKLFLMIFGGILFAVFIRAGTNKLRDKTGMPDSVAFGVSVLLLGVIIWLLFSLLAPTLATEIERIQEALPQSLERIEQAASRHTWSRYLVSELDNNFMDMLPAKSELVSRAGNIISTTLSGLVTAFIIIIIGLFFAFDPRLYTRGFVRLFPVEKRARLLEVFHLCYEGLKSWLWGKFIAMVFVGVLTGVGLAFLAVPMALALGFIMFAFDFIPKIGPFLAAAPGLLIAATLGTDTVLYVALLYFVVQSIESYILSPIVFKKAVSLSPVVGLSAIVLFGILAGPLGVVLATPIASVAQILVTELYVKDVLEEHVFTGGEIAGKV